MKRTIALVLAALLLVGLVGVTAGCKKAETASEKVKVALVVAGTFGDRAFYDSSKAGAERLIADKNVEMTQIECKGENHATFMRNAADKNEVVVCVGWEFWEIEEVAPEYPDVHWIWIDNETSAPIKNVLNITYAQNEGSYVAGYVAAAMSKSGVIGAVGGEDTATINDFIIGYEEGAKAFSPDIKIVKNYSNSYDDPALGKECALALNDQGADVIFQIASACGDGVFEAGEARGFYAIGVDSDQKYINDKVIIASMKKEVGNSIYDAVSEYLAGNTSKWGTTWVADLKAGYVGVSYGEKGSTQQVSDEIKAAADEIAKKIVSGEIKVSTTRG